MAENERDRDTGGRPKNARPRDALGRPLPRDAANAMPEEEPARTPEEALARGIEHFNAGRYFQAHEAWEEGWHPAPEPERDFWQGLTQVAVGLTHRLRGNAHGSATLLRRGAKRLSGYGTTHMGVPVGEISKFAADAADRVEREGVEAPIEVPPITKEDA
jgi:predicted metal-dependent hydrolase